MFWLKELPKYSHYVTSVVLVIILISVFFSLLLLCHIGHAMFYAIPYFVNQNDCFNKDTRVKEVSVLKYFLTPKHLQC